MKDFCHICDEYIDTYNLKKVSDGSLLCPTCYKDYVDCEDIEDD